MTDLAARIHRAARLSGSFRLRSGETSSLVAGRRLAVIEDVATSGGQMVQSIEDLRREGAVIDTALCVIDREAGAVGRLSSIGVRLEALFRLSELS